MTTVLVMTCKTRIVQRLQMASLRTPAQLGNDW